MDNIELVKWIKKLQECDIQFKNDSPIEPVELVCVIDDVTEEIFYCTMLTLIHDNNEELMVFIDKEYDNHYRLAYNIPTHWAEKIHSVEIYNKNYFMNYQSQNIFNYITVLMNKMICYIENFNFYSHALTDKDLDKLVDEFAQIYFYICEMLKENNIINLGEQITICNEILYSFITYYHIYDIDNIIVLTTEYVVNKLNEKHSKLDVEVWSDFFDELFNVGEK